jgi:hypothetical protein
MVTMDATSASNVPLVTVVLRLMKCSESGAEDKPNGPEVPATRPRSTKLTLGAALPTGGTAAEEVDTIDKGIMVRYRGWLDGWRTVLKEMFQSYKPRYILDSVGLN